MQGIACHIEIEPGLDVPIAIGHVSAIMIGSAKTTTKENFDMSNVKMIGLDVNQSHKEQSDRTCFEHWDRQVGTRSCWRRCEVREKRGFVTDVQIRPNRTAKL